MIPFSILDLSPVGEGENVSKALENSRRMAIHAEDHGYERVWLAEHHGMGAGHGAVASENLVGSRTAAEIDTA